jgi:hypothetical protein
MGKRQFEFRIADFELWVRLIFDFQFSICLSGMNKMDKEEPNNGSEQTALRVIRLTMSLPRGNV